MKTLFVKEHEAARAWFVIDAENKPVGRVASKASYMLRGKHKATYAPHQEMGDYIVIINAGKAVVSGNKPEGKIYYHHTGFVGHLNSMNFNTLMKRHPEDPIRLAIKGMLPKGPLGRQLMTNVKTYAGAEHPHAAQNPQVLEV